MGEWSRDEEIVLLDFYFNSPEPTHTDSDPLCGALAEQLGHTPSAVDMRLRNIRSIEEKRGLPNAAASLKALLVEFHSSPSAFKDAADEVRQRRGRQRIIGT